MGVSLADAWVFRLSATEAVAANNYDNGNQSASSYNYAKQEVPEPRRDALRLSQLWNLLPETFQIHLNHTLCFQIAKLKLGSQQLELVGLQKGSVQYEAVPRKIKL